MKNEDNLDVQITTWTWVDDEEFLTEYNETWYLGLPGLDMQQYTSEELQEILTEMLPKQISAVQSNSAG